MSDLVGTDILACVPQIWTFLLVLTLFRVVQWLFTVCTELSGLFSDDTCVYELQSGRNGKERNTLKNILGHCQTQLDTSHPTSLVQHKLAPPDLSTGWKILYCHNGSMRKHSTACRDAADCSTPKRSRCCRYLQTHKCTRAASCSCQRQVPRSPIPSSMLQRPLLRNPLSEYFKSSVPLFLVVCGRSSEVQPRVVMSAKCSSVSVFVSNFLADPVVFFEVPLVFTHPEKSQNRLPFFDRTGQVVCIESKK